MLQVENISKYYGHGPTEVAALEGVSFEITPGEYAAIMGPSGSGKSTLLNIIGGLDRPSKGQVLLDGQRIDNLDEDRLVEVRRKKIAYIFQQYHLLPSLNALENVALPLTFGGSRDIQQKAEEMLGKVGLAVRASHRPGELSGGEQQRVAIARALVNNPRLILADEPTGNMDRTTGARILGLFDELNREGHTIIVVTHDKEVAGRTGRTINLKDGKLAGPARI